MRLLLIILAIVLVYLVVRGMMRGRAAHRSAAAPAAERMVPCAHCGVNLPEREALGSPGRFYCSEEHRRLAGR